VTVSREMAATYFLFVPVSQLCVWQVDMTGLFRPQCLVGPESPRRMYFEAVFVSDDVILVI